MGMRTKIHSKRHRSELGTGRELIDLLTKAEERAKAMAYKDIAKCLELAIHLMRLKYGLYC